ncbi:MAG TPA: dipeptidase [Pilimelia sp.]|nr:dipeptidase [Pilimelia sp.]
MSERSAGPAGPARPTAERVRAVLAGAPVVDGHNDLAWELRRRVRYDTDRLDPSVDQRGSGLHTDLVRLAEGGVGAQFWSVFVADGLPGANPVAATLEQIDFIRRWVASHPDRLALCTTAAEVESARRAGRLASLIGMEGGHSIACSLGALRMMHALGARYLTLTHVRNTPWADSATDDAKVGGLSPFGLEVVRELNRLSMLVDLSHVAVTTMHAALDTSAAPAFFSHSSARALCDHPRNVPDDVLTRVRDTAGIVMVTFVPWFLTEAYRDWSLALGMAEERLAAAYPADSAAFVAARDRWVAGHARPPCGVADAADHVEHVREVAGLDAVALGGDFDGIPVTPVGLADVSTYPVLLAELADRGWSDAELAALTWRNALRVLRDTEAAGRAARAARGPSLATLPELDGGP